MTALDPTTVVPGTTGHPSQRLDRNWRKSSRSNANGSCVEVRRWHDKVQIRDTKNRRGGILSFHTDSWRRFVADVQEGHFDRR